VGSDPKRNASAQHRLAAQRAAAARERLAAAQRRRRLLVVGGPVLAVLLVLIALVVVKVTSGEPKSGPAAVSADARIVAQVTGVPAAVLDTVGVGSLKNRPEPITGDLLTANGKPRVLYIGAEYCPFCATERWPVVVALSRFGTFTGLGQTNSSAKDVYPSTATLTFHGAAYQSDYLSFTGTEMESNELVGGRYAPLDALAPADQAIFDKLSANGAIPFTDIGGRYRISGASYDAGLLQGKTHAQIAAALADPESPIAKGIDGTANVLTAAICSLTDNQPVAVCTAPGVVAGAAVLGHG
jgi:Domain of unknown function (DUF929)